MVIRVAFLVLFFFFLVRVYVVAGRASKAKFKVEERNSRSYSRLGSVRKLSEALADADID